MTTHGTSTRRGFLAALGGLLASLWAWPLARAKKVKKLAFDLSKVKKLTKVGGWTTVKLDGRQILMVRDSKETVRAFDPTCPHKQCPIDTYDPETKLLRCPCHESGFDLDGTVVEGPAPKPLTVYATKLEGDRLVVTLPVEKE